MLSTKSSMSVPISSRNHSHMVKAEGDADGAPGFVHLAKRLGGLERTCDTRHSRPNTWSPASATDRCPRECTADAGEHRRAAARPSDAGDQLLEDTLFAGPRRKSRLAAADEAAQVDSDAGLAFRLGRELGNGSGSRHGRVCCASRPSISSVDEHAAQRLARPARSPVCPNRSRSCRDEAVRRPSATARRDCRQCCCTSPVTLR